MKSEEQIRAALDYYRDLTERACDYWDEHPTAQNYTVYQEYMAKRDALEWMLGEGDDIARKADYPVHTVFYPDYVAEMKRRESEGSTDA